MKKPIAIVLFIILMLTPCLLTGCTDTDVVVDGIKLKDTKIVATEGRDTGVSAEYKVLKFTCVVENTTDSTLSFEVVYSYKSGSFMSMSPKNFKQEIVLSPGESKSLSYTTDKIYGLIEQGKIYVQKVNQEPLDENNY